MRSRDMRKRIALGLVGACLLFSGCGSKSKANAIFVQVAGISVLFPAQTETVTAVVTGATDTSVTWDCSYTTTPNPTTTTPNPTASTPAECTSANGAVGALSNPLTTTVTFTAPQQFPDQTKFPNVTIIITATANADKKTKGTFKIALDSGIRVTISPATATVGTGESFQFTAGLTNDTTPNDVTWFVTQDTPPITTTSKHCDPGCGSVDSTGKYTAPATVPTTCTTSTTSTPCTVTLVAVSKVDNTRAAAATVTVVKAAAITFTGISPTLALQGGILQDIYLNAANLRSTVSVLFNNVQVDPSQLKIVNASLARLRLNASNLAGAGPAQISVQFTDPTTGNLTTLTQSLQIVTVRPGLINSVPDSFPPGSLPGPVRIDGGFYGPSSSPIVTAQFNGNNEAVTSSNSRQLSVNLTAVPSGGPGAAGLYPVSVINSSASPSLAVSNVAVQPDFAGSNPACLFTTLNLPVPSGSTAASTVPSAISIDPILEYAAVTEEATNTVQFINLSTLVPPATCPSSPAVSAAPSSLQFPVGSLPTSVAIDEFLSPSPGNHLAAVVNNGDKSLTLLQIPSGAAIATVDLSQLLPPASGTSSSAPSPYSIGIDPFTHRALVAFASTNAGFIVNLDPTQSPTCLGGGAAPYCAISSVGLNTGAHPQIVFDAHLRVAFVTPGGAGRMSIVDLNQLTSASTTPIAAAPDGAKRTNNVVTIATTQAHNIDPGKLGTVFINGVANGANGTDFNGSFSVTSVIDATHFTYFQTAKDDTSGGGSVSTVPNPMLTFSISATVQGIALNPQTHVAALADPNTQFGQISFIKTPDETVTSLTLTVGSFLNNSGSATPEIGAAQVGFQPFSNVAVSFNPLRNEVSLIDPVRPQRLALASGTGQTGIGSFTPAGSSTAVSVNGALAVDPSTNLALVVNSGQNPPPTGSTTKPPCNISVLQLGQLKPVHIDRWLLQASVPATPPLLLAPQTAFTASTGLPISVFGSGFSGSPTVRLDGVSVGSGTVVSDRQIDITIPASFLAVPRRFALDVVNGGTLSNATDFAVAQSVDLSVTGCTALQPTGVVVGENIQIASQPVDLAMVTLNGCNAASLIDLTGGSTTFGQVTQTIAVGTAPTGVALIPRLGLAVVANSTASGTSTGSGTASVIDLTKSPPVVTQTVTVGTEPTGVAINPDTGQAYVVNTKSNTVTQVDLTVSPPKATGTGAFDEQPIAIAIDPDRQVAVTGAVSISAGSLFGSGVLDVWDISGTSPVRRTSISAFTSLPTGVVFDPVSTQFFAVDSLSNDFVIANPDTGGAQTVRVGVNPTALAYDYQTGTLITVNTISNTVSFVDVVDPQRAVTKATLPLGVPPQSVGLTNPQFGVAIHLRSNLAVIADLFNNRVLLYPMPH